MSADGDKFFSKVTTRVDRERVFRWLIEGGLPFQIQNQKKELIIVKAIGIKDAILIVKPLKKHAKLEGGVIVTIDFPEEKYFFKSRILEVKSEFFLDISQDIYKLQRRDNFRITMPDACGAKIELAPIANEKEKHQFDVVNLSGGGFAIDIGPTDKFVIVSGEWVLAELTIGGRFKKNFYAIVRHAKSFGSHGSGLIRVGFEFSGLAESDKQEIVALVMGIYRDMFSRFKIK